MQLPIYDRLGNVRAEVARRMLRHGDLAKKAKLKPARLSLLLNARFGPEQTEKLLPQVERALAAM
jgi:hypothetical protein